MIKEKMKEGTLTISDILRSPRETRSLLLELEGDKIVPKVEGDKVYLYKKSGEPVTTEVTPFSFDLERRFRSMRDSNEALASFFEILGDSYVNHHVISFIMSLIDSLEKAVYDSYKLKEENVLLIDRIEKLKAGHDFENFEPSEKKETIQ